MIRKFIKRNFSVPPRISPKSLESLPRTEISKLSNNIKIATENYDMDTATVGVYVDAGSRFENEKNNGVAHFLEHMFFKGTNNRTRQQIEKEIENIGGHLNAYTSREMTCYYAKVFSKDVPKAVNILADILQNSALKESDIERERSVILRELEEVERQMEETIFDHLHAVAYQTSSLGLTILGPRENISTISRSQLVDYIKNNYVGPRMVISAVGGVNHQEFAEMCEKEFSRIPSTSKVIKPEPALWNGAEVRIPDVDYHNAHVVIAVEGVSWQSPDYFASLILQSIVGSWDRSLASGANLSSRLAQVVEKYKLAQSFMSFNTSYTDTGLFGIYLQSDRTEGLDDLIYEVQQEWMRICLNLTDNEVSRAKLQLKASLMMALDGTTEICEDVGRQVLTLGKRYSLKEMSDQIDNISTSDVKQVANKYIYNKCPAVAAYGPIDTLPDYNRIRSSMLWLRS